MQWPWFFYAFAFFHEMGGVFPWTQGEHKAAVSIPMNWTQSSVSGLLRPAPATLDKPRTAPPGSQVALLLPDTPVSCVPPRWSPCRPAQLWPAMCCLKSLHCLCLLCSSCFKKLNCFFRDWKGVFGKPADFDEIYYCLWIKGSLDGSY